MGWGRQLPARPAEHTAGVRPSLPNPSVQTPKGTKCTPGITLPENRPQRFSEPLLTREDGGSPGGPSLSRASPDRAEQGTAGLDRVGQDGAVGSGRG